MSTWTDTALENWWSDDTNWTMSALLARPLFPYLECLRRAALERVVAVERAVPNDPASGPLWIWGDNKTYLEAHVWTEGEAVPLLRTNNQMGQPQPKNTLLNRTETGIRQCETYLDLSEETSTGNWYVDAVGSLTGVGRKDVLAQTSDGYWYVVGGPLWFYGTLPPSSVKVAVSTAPLPRQWIIERRLFLRICTVIAANRPISSPNWTWYDMTTGPNPFAYL